MTLTLAPVTGALFLPDDVTPVQGTVTLTPNSGPLVDPVSNRILTGAVTLQFDALGSVAVQLPRTDSTGIQPAANSWNWRASFNLVNGSIAPFNFALTGPVDLADVIQVAALDGDYIVVPGPQGLKGDKGDKGDTGTAGSGGSPIYSVLARVAVENIVLPANAGWAVVTTTTGVLLQAQIQAATNDRLWLDANSMRGGSGNFLDFAVIVGGHPVWFLATRSSTPPAEGLPEMYPGVAFPNITGTFQIPVQADWVDGNGMVTIAEVVSGPGDGGEVQYASGTYAWELLVRNPGPEPVRPT